MKYFTKNGFVINEDKKGDFECEQELGRLFSWRGFPRYKVVDGKVEAVSPEFELASKEYYDKILAEREKRYALYTDKLNLEYQFMLNNDDPKADEKKQEWIDAVKKIKSDLPKPEVSTAFNL